MCEDRQLGYVVEDDESEEHQNQDESGLIDTLLDHHVDVVAKDALDEQEQDHSAIEDWEWEQVENAEVEADGGSKAKLGEPAFHLSGLAGHAGNADRTGELLDRN